MSYNPSIFLAATRLGPPAGPMFQTESPLERLANGAGLVILLLLVSLCWVAFILLMAALLPQVTEQSKKALLASPWRAFFIGLANYLFLGGISLVLLNLEPVAWLGLLLAAGLIVVTGLGLAGLVSLVGERLAALQGGELSPLRQLVWGSVVVELAGLLPFAGWFLLAPALAMLAFGAAVLGWRQRRGKQNSWEVA